MFTHYLTIGWRHLRRSPLYSFINVLGLSIGVAACVLIFLFVQDEVTYDAFHTNSDRIYRLLRTPNAEGAQFALNRGVTPYMPVGLGPALTEEIPGVAAAVRLLSTEEVTVAVGNRLFGDKVTFSDPALFDVFSFPLASGDARSALSSPTGAVLSQKLARKYFGTEDAIGKSMQITLYGGEPQQYQVTGVLSEHPSNSSIQFDLLLPTTSSYKYPLAMTRWFWWRAETYVLLQPGVTRESVEAKLTPLYGAHLAAEAVENPGTGPSKSPFDISMQPLRDVHFNSQYGGSKPLYSYVLSSIALAVLLIACINFITLAMARSMTRAREVSVRKVFGAVRGQLVRQFWGESLIIATSAVVAGLVLAELALPVFNALANKSLSLHVLTNLPLVSVVLFLLALLAMAAGSVPAFVLARLQPARILYRQANLAKNSPLAKGLIVVQFALSITLVICMWGMFNQQKYIQNKPLGYVADQVIVVSNTAPHSTDSADLLNRLRTALAADSRVVSVAGASLSFARGYDRYEWRVGDKTIDAYMYKVEPQFVPTLQLSLVAGRNFSDEHLADARSSVIVNEAMVRTLGLTDPIGKPVTGFSWGDSLPAPLIAGVVADFHSSSMRQQIDPVILHMNPDDPFGAFLVRVNGADLTGAVASVERAWADIAQGSRFSFSFLDDDIAAQYQSERRWLSVITYSSVVAIIIASLGLFGLAGVSAVRRMKEISIRKVLGAGMPELLQTLNREFLVLICAANLLAWPAAYYILSKWLQTFAYRTDLSVWMFVLAGVAAMLVALLAISYHTLKAASINPAEVLRHE